MITRLDVFTAPSLSARDWSVPSCPDYPSLPQDLPRTRMLAEVIHLLRPLTHLVSLGICGSNSWKPWLLSLTMDMTSLHLHSQTARLRKEDKVELTRRAYAVCYYLLRSPFYDTYTKRRLLGTLNLFADKIPIIGNICGVLAHAIPEWQRTYSYMWTDY
jgi:peroxin-16